jgi:hypothetical protein
VLIAEMMVSTQVPGVVGRRSCAGAAVHQEEMTATVPATMTCAVATLRTIGDAFVQGYPRRGQPTWSLEVERDIGTDDWYVH